MIYEVYYPDGTLENTIVSDEAFVKQYCDKHGYSYKLIADNPMPEDPTDDTPENTEEPSVWDEMAAAYKEGVQEA